MKNVVRRYHFYYFDEKRLKDVDELALQDFLVYLKMKQGLSGSTVKQARNAACVVFKYAKRRLIRSFDFDTVLRGSSKPKERGILE
ncbi:MAG: hypothetical protein MIO92_09140 [Methanosarcinaceae archaeon]|nr:hypothetical protein [Methanosarcinaceae archaeon]